MYQGRVLIFISLFDKAEKAMLEKSFRSTTWMAIASPYEFCYTQIADALGRYIKSTGQDFYALGDRFSE
jgi:hypothetical protein